MLEGFGRRQQELLKHLLTQKQGMTIDQLALALGISRTAVNQHVAVLMRGGYIESHPLPSTGGRPGRGYVLSQRGLDAFPKQYALFAGMLLKTLLDRYGETEARGLLTQLGADLAQQLAPRVQSPELSQRVAEIAKLMHEIGYEADAPADAATPTIEAQNCIYHHLAKAHRSVCELDVVLLERLSGAQVAHTACMADGQPSCRFAFTRKSEDRTGA
jgi:predicted ArsR family transcriptional regulator